MIVYVDEPCTPGVVVATVELWVPPTSAPFDGTVSSATSPSTSAPVNVIVYFDVSATDVSSVTVTLPEAMFESDSSAVVTAAADAGAVSGVTVVWPPNSRSNVPLVAPIVTVCTSSAVATTVTLTSPAPMLESDSSAVCTADADAGAVPRRGRRWID